MLRVLSKLLVGLIIIQKFVNLILRQDIVDMGILVFLYMIEQIINQDIKLNKNISKHRKENRKNNNKINWMVKLHKTLNKIRIKIAKFLRKMHMK